MLGNLSIRLGSSTKTTKKSSWGAAIFLCLFALPFAGGGTFVGYLAVFSK